MSSKGYWKLGTKIAIFAVALTSVPLILTGVSTIAVTTNVGEKILGDVASNKMMTLRDTKKSQVEDYFHTIENQVLTMSNDTMVIDAMKAFKDGYDQYSSEAGGGAQDIDAKRAKVTNYYVDMFGKEYQQRNSGRRPNVNALVSGMTDAVVSLQFDYIVDNAAALGEKDELESAAAPASYNRAHAKYHAKIRMFLKKFGYYDIFLIDQETGNVVYSVYKEIDYATSLRDGPYAHTGLSSAFKKVADVGGRDVVALSDFSPYTPSYEDQASFIASPIFDGDKQVGVLAFQVPIDRVNALMTYGGRWEEVGLGKTGETYLVGADGTPRSVSRFLIEDKEGFLASVRENGVSEAELGLIRDKASNIGLQKIRTDGVRLARQHRNGVGVYPDYRGEAVLGAYAPVNINGLDWVIVSEIDQAEAMLPNSELRSAVLFAAIIVMVALVLLAVVIALLAARRMTGPILQITDGIRTIERDVDLAHRIHVDTRDEVGDTSIAFNSLVESFQDIIRDVSQVTAAMAEGDLSQSLKEEYRGDFAQLRDGVDKALLGLNAVLAETRQVVVDVNGSAAQLSASSQAVATAAHQQSAAAHHSMSALDETSSVAEANAAHAADVDAIVSEAAASVSESRTRMTEMMHSMTEIDQSSKDIVRIIEVIDDIAFQTNLLALNATVEAARAGRHGLGFAAVAQEVRSLAERSARAAKETSELVARSGQKIKEGVTVAQSSAEAMETIASSIERVRSFMSEITASSKEQAIGIHEVRGAMQQVNVASQSAMEQSSKLAAASEALTKMTQSLSEELARFQLQGGTQRRTQPLLGVTPIHVPSQMDAAPVPAAAPDVPLGASVDPAAVLPLDEDERGFGDF